MLAHEKYGSWVYEDFSGDLEDDDREDAFDKLRAQRDAAVEAKKLKERREVKRRQALCNLLERWHLRKLDEREHRRRTFLKWHHIARMFERIRFERIEAERLKRLELMGESWAKFAITSNVKGHGNVEVMVEITRFRNPTYYKMTVENTANAKRDDTVQQRIAQLPEPLRANESDLKKIKSVFRDKLQVVWLPKEHWRVHYGRNQAGGERATHVPLMQDAFVDNTVVREEVIHKVVEVKVWDEYHRKKPHPVVRRNSGEMPDFAPSPPKAVITNDKGNRRYQRDSYGDEYPQLHYRRAVSGEGEDQLIAQDAAYMSEILREMMDSVQGLEMGAGGLKAWHARQSGRNDGMVTIGMFASLLRTLDIKFKLEHTGFETKNDDKRLLGMLFRFFDKDNTGLLNIDEFCDVMINGFNCKMK